jgi:hypothetical protein
MADNEIKSTRPLSADFSVTDHILAASEKVAKTWRGGTLSGRAIAFVGGGMGLLTDASIQTIFLILKTIPVLGITGAYLLTLPAYLFKGKPIDLSTREISLTALQEHAMKIADYTLSFVHVPIAGLIDPSWAADLAQTYGYGDVIHKTQAQEKFNDLKEIKQKIEYIKEYELTNIIELNPKWQNINKKTIENLDNELNELVNSYEQAHYDAAESNENYSMELEVDFGDTQEVQISNKQERLDSTFYSSFIEKCEKLKESELFKTVKQFPTFKGYGSYYKLSKEEIEKQLREVQTQLYSIGIGKETDKEQQSFLATQPDWGKNKASYEKFKKLHAEFPKRGTKINNEKEFEFLKTWNSLKTEFCQLKNS